MKTLTSSLLVAGVCLALADVLQAFVLLSPSMIIRERGRTQHSFLSATWKEEQDDLWTMEHDWALLDQLPRFTVGEDSSNVRTFWTQLSASTPILIHKEPSQLVERCRQLDADHELVYGPSPALLQNWQVDFHRRDGKAVGQTEDGRTIWLRYHCIGRLEGDPLSEMSASVLSLVPGGYLEAVGGRIYELGQPRLDERSHTVSSWVANHDGNIAKEEDETPKSTTMAWWVPATTATMSALLASTVLSACIGYGAGLSIISDGSSFSSYSASTTTVPIQRLPSSSTTNNEPSFAERRARTEYRILREQRVVQKISEQLENDKMELNNLREQEQQWINNPNQFWP
jgi:hypothetical protein